MLGVAVAVVLLSSALASGTEVALFAAGYGAVLAAEAEGRPGAEALRRVKDDMARPIMAIVIWNNVANIVGSIVVGAMAAEVLGSPWVGVFSGVLTLMVIVFAEIIPKTVGERHALAIALVAARPVLLVATLMFPLIVIIEQVVKPFQSSDTPMTSESEIAVLSRLGGEAGIIEEDESAMIRRVFRLNDITAGDILTPIDQVDALPADQRLSEVAEWLTQVTHSRILVFSPGVGREVEGVMHVRGAFEALIGGNGHRAVRDVAVAPSFVPDTMAGDDLLRHFQTRKQHLSMVVNGHGTVLGIVTLEDILEELVGEIVDETDDESEGLERPEPGVLVVRADTDLRDIHRLLDPTLPEEGVFGQLVVEELGRIPEVGEVFRIGALKATVEEASALRVERVRLERIEEESA